MTQKTLKQFYREIQQWIDDGCPEHDVFKTYRPLCRSINAWSSFDPHLSAELKGQFLTAGLHRDYPFNMGDPDNYGDEANDDTVFKNPARLAWIKEHSK